MLRIISTRPGTSTSVVGLTTGISPIPALISTHVYISEPVYNLAIYPIIAPNMCERGSIAIYLLWRILPGPNTPLNEPLIIEPWL